MTAVDAAAGRADDGRAFVRATYRIETPLDPHAVADIMAGEQSSGTFRRVAGETDALRARARAVVEAVEPLESVDRPSLPNARLDRERTAGPYRRARVRIAYPVANIGANLPTLAATVAGNLYDLGEITGLRLEALSIPASYRARFAYPRVGIDGTRRLTGVATGALVGTIVKPNVGLTLDETAALVAQLCDAGVDFVKDDEVCGNPDHAPLEHRIAAVMRVVRRHRDRTGRHVMVAFNISDETDAMRRHADRIADEEGTCAMVSLNWCGLSAVETLRRHTPLAIHGHRNGFGALSRAPLLGIGYQAYQSLWRLAGVDHMHVHGLQGKFAQPDDEVVDGARACYRPVADDEADGRADLVMPAFSSGQWAGTVQPTWDAIGRDDLLFMSGGGILAHPDGAAAGVRSIRQAWAAVRDGVPLDERARDDVELAHALAFFGAR